MGPELSSAYESARAKVSENEAQSALDILDSMPLIEKVTADWWLLRGIALSQNNQFREATEAFEHSLSEKPESTSIRYNYALHSQYEGDLGRAFNQVNEVLRLDPKHQGAAVLLAEINALAAAKELSRQQLAGERVTIPAPAKKVDAVTYLMAALCLLGLANFCVVAGIVINAFSSNAVSPNDVVGLQKIFDAHPLSFWSMVIHQGTWLGSIGLMTYDVMKRRMPGWWLLPNFFFGLAQLHFIPQFFYLVFRTFRQK